MGKFLGSRLSPPKVHFRGCARTGCRDWRQQELDDRVRVKRFYKISHAVIGRNINKANYCGLLVFVCAFYSLFCYGVLVLAPAVLLSTTLAML